MKLTIYRDNTSTLQIQAFHENGSVVLLTGCDVLMCLKTNQGMANVDAIITKSTQLGTITLTDPINGIFQTRIETLETRPFIDTTILYTDFLITDTFGEAFTIANTTTIEVKANYSRR